MAIGPKYYIAVACVQALLEKLENRKLAEAEVVQLLKAKHLQTAQKGAGQSAVDVSNYVEWNFTAAKTIVTKLQSSSKFSCCNLPLK